MQTLSIIRQYRDRYLDRSTTVRQEVEKSLATLRRVQPQINAVTDFLDDMALEAADQADRQLQAVGDSPTLPSLFGIPFSIKGALAVEGHPWVGGSWHRRNTLAPFTAPVVMNAIRHGAIPVCVTNTPEAMVWIETSNQVYGRTSNPYDTRRTSGGSSGGEAAVLASRATVFGIGTDLGGSARIPASFCGISGFKPSPGAVSEEGQWPAPFGDIIDYAIISPMAQTARDLESVFNAIRKLDFDLPTFSDFKVSNLKVLVCEEMPCISATEETKNAVREAAEKLKSAGATVETFDASLFKNAPFIWLSLLEANPVKDISFGEILGVNGFKGIARELAKIPVGLSKHTFPALGFALLEELTKVSPFKLSRFLNEGLELRKKLNSLLAENTVLLSPTFPRAAPLHNHARFRPQEFIYSGICNVMKLPSASVPVSISKAGLPLGVQITSAYKNDFLVLKASVELEEKINPPSIAIA